MTTATTAPKSKPKPSSNYLPWEEAREYIRNEHIPSRGKYEEWWDTNKPKVVPRFPYRAYAKNWISWNDFLGANNTFAPKAAANWIPMTEAMKFVHPLRLETQADWLEFVKTNKKPARIPNRPDLTYKEWKGWAHWLGQDIVKALERKQQLRQSPVYFIIHERGFPDNVLTIGSDPHGLPSFYKKYVEHKFDIIRMYWYDQKQAPALQHIINSLTKPYQDYTRQRLVPNVWDLIYHFQFKLEGIKKEDALEITHPLGNPIMSQPQVSEDTDQEDAMAIFQF